MTLTTGLLILAVLLGILGVLGAVTLGGHALLVVTILTGIVLALRLFGKRDS